ncbi:Gfo/Idh/MocA family protein [Piscinibacter sp. HJYY11]|uniref:Gfo/Idh/MocA family protein n=1 Tax=Piscinibacter sp. HJYY11 TaxID=2801333 RepID=UPI0019200A26|nr:Gfo/Idh/MocA family oxidoreductase [Piscinibacter sp. HJYY11]MBL0729614.1 Gfo/Idh/MocA family oxidoreductase [Piscinibacter sp. HJYY11]
MKWGLIGASNVASEHMVSAIRAQPGHEVVAVMSGNASRAQEFAKANSIAEFYDDVDRLLAQSKVDAVYVSSTNEKHCAQVIAAAAAGKHILCEKPLALTVEDAMAMRDACAQAGVVLGTNHHLRNAATIRKIRELVRSGAIGRPLCARVFHAVHLPPHLQGWRVDKPQAGGGVVLDITVHDADTLRFVLDAEPVEVVGMTQSTSMSENGVADGVMAVIRFDNGVMAQMHEAFTVRHAGTGIEIHGEIGSVIGRNVMTQRPVGEVVIRDALGEREVEVQHENLYVRSVAEFSAAVRGAGRPAATAEDGVMSLAVAAAVAEASRSGCTVRVMSPFK